MSQYFYGIESKRGNQRGVCLHGEEWRLREECEITNFVTQVVLGLQEGLIPSFRDLCVRLQALEEFRASEPVKFFSGHIAKIVPGAIENKLVHDQSLAMSTERGLLELRHVAMTYRRGYSQRRGKLLKMWHSQFFKHTWECYSPLKI